MPGKTIGEKLMLKPGQTLLLVKPPVGYDKSLGALPKETRLVKATSGKVDVIQAFARSKTDLQTTLPKLRGMVNPAGMIWMTYPKGTSKIKSDINRDSIREYTLGVGLETVALIAVDDDWSAIRCKVA